MGDPVLEAIVVSETGDLARVAEANRWNSAGLGQIVRQVRRDPGGAAVADEHDPPASCARLAPDLSYRADPCTALIGQRSRFVEAADIVGQEIRLD